MALAVDMPQSAYGVGGATAGARTTRNGVGLVMRDSSVSAGCGVPEEDARGAGAIPGFLRQGPEDSDTGTSRSLAGPHRPLAARFSMACRSG